MPEQQQQQQQQRQLQIPFSTPRIHTTLSSWTRWPSHTRPERALSAGLSDSVIVRDFADPATRRHGLTAQVLRTQLHQLQPGMLDGLKHTAKTIVSIAKFYSSVWTSPESYRGANRRTSTTVSTGTLVHPELEMVVLGANQEGDVFTNELHRHLKEVERQVEEEVEKAEEEAEEEEQAGAVVAKREVDGKGPGKGRAMGLKLDLGAIKSGSPGWDKLAGAKAGTPFIEKGGFDWSGGGGGGGGGGGSTGGSGGGSGKGKGKGKLGGKAGLKLDLGAFTFGGGGGGGGNLPPGLARMGSGFERLEGAKAGTPFVEKTGFDFSFSSHSSSSFSTGRGSAKVDVDPMAAVDEDEEVAP